VQGANSPKRHVFRPQFEQSAKELARGCAFARQNAAFPIFSQLNAPPSPIDYFYAVRKDARS
jgi:hypothetical protein